MPWSEVQQKHLSIWPHFTGPLSMIGSGLIIYEVLRDPTKRRKVYHRLLLAMSICDFNTSFWYSLSTVPIPAETQNVFAPLGTQGSCTAQGFMVQLGIATPLYNAALALYYLLIVRFQWKEKQMERAEKFFHAVPLFWAAATSIAALAMKMLNNANLWCWIASVPLGCTGSHRNGGVNDCERGNNAWIFRWAFFYAPLWAAIFLSGVAMVLTYNAVRSTEQKTDLRRNQLDVPSGDPNHPRSKKAKGSGKHSKQVASQAFYYLLAFFFSWTPATLTRFIQMVWGKTYFPIILLMAVFTPMQGFLNFLVYSRPRWIRFRKKNPDWNIFKAWYVLFFKRDDLDRTSATRRSSGDNFSQMKKSTRRLSSFKRPSFNRQASQNSVISEAPVEQEQSNRDGAAPVRQSRKVSFSGDGVRNEQQQQEEEEPQERQTQEEDQGVENGKEGPLDVPDMIASEEEKVDSFDAEEGKGQEDQ